MIVYDNFLQRSIEWHEIKWGKIGGTLSSGLLKPTDTLFFDILSQRGEECELTDGYTSPAMENGIEMEPYVVKYVEDYTGLKFNTPAWLQCEKNELLGISPDGITDDLKVAMESKCFGRKKHWEVLMNNTIPLENIPQVIHYFTIIPELEKLYFIAFRHESAKHFITCVTPESVVNIGTNSNPVLKTVSEASVLARKNADLLLERVNKAIDYLNF